MLHDNYDARLDAAIDRDLRDAERLDFIANLVANMLDALIPDAHDLEHPNARWNPDDLIVDLRSHAKNIAFERQRLAGPVVIE